MFPLSLLLLPFFAQTSWPQVCRDSCEGGDGPPIRFPFGLNTAAESQCTYPGFELECNNRKQTILSLPSIAKFQVQYIDYRDQAIYIRDPEACLPKRFLHNFNLTGTPFESQRTDTLYTFLNCTANSSVPNTRQIDCLSDDDFTVYATLTAFYYGDEANYAPFTGSCSILAAMVMVPVAWLSYSDADTSLLWNTPDCTSCEMRGGTCGLQDADTLSIGCYSLPRATNSGLPRSVKYGLTVGIGIPGIVFLLGVACCVCGRIRAYNHQQRHANANFSVSIGLQPSVAITGLDRPTIESYPKMLLGESKRLPRPNDNTCPICLLDYQPKDTLKMIPECCHYFHIDCIDEWLRLNRTCPLCRASPEGSDNSTQSSSLLSTPSTLSSSSVNGAISPTFFR